MRHRHERAHGFSLVELVLVVSIMAILAGIAVPRLNEAMDTRRADAAASRIIDDMNLAAQRARAQSQNVEVRFRPALRRYLIDGVHPFTKRNGYVVDLTAEPYAVSAMATIGFASGILTFDPWGEPDVDGEIRLVVGNERRAVNIVSNTPPTMTRLSRGRAAN